MTGSSRRPRVRYDGRQRRSASATPRASAGKRRSRVQMAICPSSRASGAPRQKWMPWPNDRWACGAADVERRAGSGRVAVGRAEQEQHGRRAGMSPRRAPMSSVGKRADAAGPGRRSAAAPRPALGERRGSARSRTGSWSGCRRSASRPLPIRLTWSRGRRQEGAGSAIESSSSSVSWSLVVVGGDQRGEQVVGRAPPRLSAMSLRQESDYLAHNATASSARFVPGPVVSRVPVAARRSAPWSAAGMPSRAQITVTGSGAA